MLPIDGFVAFLALFVLFVALGFGASKWRKGDLGTLHEWALAGRRLGTALVWFLVGADLYTAYTFIAVPSSMYAVGSIYFFAVPYVALTFAFAMLLLPRLWKISRERGYITAADFVKDEFSSSTLAILVAIVGIVAELPYIALQIVGMQAVLSAMLIGVSDVATVSELSLIVAFIVLAAFTYTSGLRGATVTAVLKDALIFVAIIGVIVVVAVSGGFHAAFANLKPVYTTLPTKFYNAYWSLFLMSALALYLYPHAINGALSAEDPEKLRKSTSLLPLYGIGLAFLALFGVLIYGNSAALALVKTFPAASQGVLVVPSLILSVLPSWFAGIAFLGIFIGGLVPAAIMAISQANLLTRNIIKEFKRNITPQQETTISKWTSVIFKFLALGFVFVIPATYAIQLQLFGGVLILQTLPAVFLALITKRLNKYASIVGLLGGIATGLYLMEIANGFSKWHTTLYNAPFGLLFIGVTALGVNLIITIVGSLVIPVKPKVAVATEA
ncbi:MAG: sodium:solute symporter [Thaumarchaeota archaeon]|nr:sodium:solute symporter [Nitrososphaerota archaeon]MDG6905342.1 sodium:solute symporter [Nitrososphaerota archaeon]